LFDDIIGEYDRRKKRKNRLRGKESKEGRTWKQIAMSFARDAVEKLRETPEGFAIAGRVLREIVGDPNNSTLRRHCKDFGVKISKSKGQDIYRIEVHNRVHEELKKHDK
jgi:hypothetical protein